MGRRDKLGDNPQPSAIDGAIICTNAGTTTEKNITEWANLQGADILLETVENFTDALGKFEAGQCDVVTTDASGLVANKVAAEIEGRIAVDEWVIFPAFGRRQLDRPDLQGASRPGVPPERLGMGRHHHLDRLCDVHRVRARRQFVEHRPDA